jgi:hypothetical protein
MLNAVGRQINPLSKLKHLSGDRQVEVEESVVEEVVHIDPAEVDLIFPQKVSWEVVEGFCSLF